ncbi:unnamed protein product, partial [marine sediment metagenome]
PDIENLPFMLSIGIILGMGVAGFVMSSKAGIHDPTPAIFLMIVGVIFSWWVGWLPAWVLLITVALISIVGAAVWMRIFKGGGD